MNDTKWLETLSFLRNSGVTACGWKFAGDEQIYNWGVPLEDDVETELYVGLRDQHGFQPCHFSDIEWIQIASDESTQGVTRLMSTIGVPVESQDDVLKIMPNVSQ